MAKFRPIKKPRTVLERWKDRKLKKGRKMGFTKPNKYKKEKEERFRKRRKRGKRKIFFKRERVFSFPVLANLTSAHL